MKYSLVGIDGNAFAVLRYTANALKTEGLSNLKEEMYQKAMSSTHNNLLVVCSTYLDRANNKAMENN